MMTEASEAPKRPTPPALAVETVVSAVEVLSGDLESEVALEAFCAVLSMLTRAVHARALAASWSESASPCREVNALRAETRAGGLFNEARERGLAI